MIYEQKDNYYYVLPQFGKHKLITYAESLEELSNYYLENHESESIRADEEISHGESILNRKLCENRDIISRQFAEISKILKELANEAYCISKSMEKHKKQIFKILTENGVDIKDIYVVENQNGYLEIGITMRALYKEDIFESKDIARFLGKLCHNKMTVAMDMPAYINEDFVTVVFREKVRYMVIGKAAKATKAGEVYSGDNYTQTELNCGTYLAAISDGMGSGACANKDSLMIIELLEQLSEMGMKPDVAAGMVNDLLLVKMDEPRTASLDIMRLNLYNGECDFLKIGAAASFIKRKKRVETLIRHSLPLGVFQNQGKNTEPLTCNVGAGDVIVMVSDGIIDSVAEEGSEEFLAKCLEEYEFVSCKDLANQILGMAIMNGNGYIKDDMTVLVMQIQEID